MKGKYYGADIVTCTIIERRNGWKMEFDNNEANKIFEHMDKIFAPYLRVPIRIPLSINFEALETIKPDNLEVVEGKIDRIEVTVIYKEQ